MTLKNWNKIDFPLKSLNDGSSNFWTVSTGNSNEYYYNQNDLEIMPNSVLRSSLLSKGTIGNLNSNQWAWGDEDSLGYETIYLRLANNIDPDTEVADTIQCAQPYTIMQGTDTKETIFLSFIISNFSDTDDSVITVLHTDDSDDIYFKWRITIELNSSPFAIDSKICLNNQDKIKIMSSCEDISILINGDEE